jgi:hypothetical protein
MRTLSDWLGWIEIATLAIAGGSLVLHAAVLRPAIRRAMAVEEALAAQFAIGGWTLPFARLAASTAFAIAIVRLPLGASLAGGALAGLVLALVLVWGAVPIGRIRALARPWLDEAATPEPAVLARAEALDRSLALLAAAAAFVAVAHHLAC